MSTNLQNGSYWPYSQMSKRHDAFCATSLAEPKWPCAFASRSAARTSAAHGEEQNTWFAIASLTPQMTHFGLGPAAFQEGKTLEWQNPGMKISFF
eukprot:6462146-Amphidinium_carterae.1